MGLERDVVGRRERPPQPSLPRVPTGHFHRREERPKARRCPHDTDLGRSTVMVVDVSSEGPTKRRRRSNREARAASLYIEGVE
jgi:hypothetical protein